MCFTTFFYTLRWKQKYPYGAVFFGAIPGAMPVVLGYTANTSSILSIECGYLFLIMFLWQIPHFWSLAFHYKKDYTQAKIPVLPAYFGENKTFFHIGLYTLSYVGLALLAPLFLHTGFIYLIISLPIGLKILFEYYYFYKQKKLASIFLMVKYQSSCIFIRSIFRSENNFFLFEFLTKKATGQIIMNKPRLAFLCSGEGTTFEYLAQQTQFHPVCLITNIKKAPALKKAQNLNIPSLVICPSQYSSIDLWDQAVLKCLENKTIDLVILAGFLRRIGPQVLSHFKNKVINSHPSLLPKFGGQGMYGIHVHKAVHKSQEKMTGVTIHYVNEEYDQGSIIAQKKNKYFKRRHSRKFRRKS